MHCYDYSASFVVHLSCPAVAKIAAFL